MGQTKFVVILENIFILIQILYVYYNVYKSNMQTVCKNHEKKRLPAKRY